MHFSKAVSIQYVRYYMQFYFVLRLMCVWSRNKEMPIIRDKHCYEHVTTDAILLPLLLAAPHGAYFGWAGRLSDSLRIPKEISVRREYCTRSGYYLRYLTTLSVAKIAWRRCVINGISVWNTDRANPKYSRTIRPTATSSTTKSPMDCPGNELRPPRCEAGDCLLEPPIDPVLYQLT